MSKNTFVKKDVEEIKEVELEILEKEENAFIVMINGWRMRVYFEKGFEQSSKVIKVKYTGDMKDVHSVKFKKLM